MRPEAWQERETHLLCEESRGQVMSDLRPQADLSPVYCSERKGKLAWSGVETERSDPSILSVRMSLDLYTRNIPLTQKAKFWGNYVSALKGQY